MRGYIAHLSDGTVKTELELKWLELKDFLSQSNLKITNLELQYDHQRVFCRKNASVYFYMKKIEAWVQNELPEQIFYGIGASEKPGYITITWFDGNNGVEEIRKISDKDIGIWKN